MKTLDAIVRNMEKVIVGKRDVIELLMVALLCDAHVLIEDVPGVGKTSLVSALAKSIQASFQRIQFTPDTMPSDITGFSMYHPKTGEFQYVPGVVMTHLLLADEINRTSPKTQASLLEVMEEKQVTIDGTTYPVPKPFMVLATQNPIEYLGTFPLPEAQLDRFLMKVSLGYPSPEEEMRMLGFFHHKDPLSTLTPVADIKDILYLQEQVNQIHMDPSLYKYIITIVSKTREQEDVRLGVSPRGSLFLAKASRAWALYQGRSYVIPDDIKKMILPVLSHRLVVKQEALIKKRTGKDIVCNIMESTPIPLVNAYEKK